ncbi:hypothetical protein PFLUV_G00189470 [Perca fluviatilis]|uniref:Uncharacterized protein n=1 Tax=Perca fluviatilis TaxID=8168 RepID=A0A6A5EH31_PERFL|nr:hypothetical protein PFLUV_G00189470 [Perca fluviatilis]
MSVDDNLLAVSQFETCCLKDACLSALLTRSCLICAGIRKLGAICLGIRNKGSTMAERRGNWDKAEDDLPVYLARPGTADQVPRQKSGGLFSSVEGAFESKSIDFDALSVGQRGSRTPRTAKRETGQQAKSPASDNKMSPGVESPAANRRGGKDSARVEITTSGGKEVLQNLEHEKVRRRR